MSDRESGNHAAGGGEVEAREDGVDHHAGDDQVQAKVGKDR